MLTYSKRLFAALQSSKSANTEFTDLRDGYIWGIRTIQNGVQDGYRSRPNKISCH